jgi:hypothetical protein
MSDLFRDLPLSGRVPRDESQVTGDWRGQLADVVHSAAGILDSLPGGDRDRHARSFLVSAGLARESAADSLTGLSEAVRDGRRRRVRELSRAVGALLALARDTGSTVSLAPLTSGAVALYRATSAPLAIRAVVGGHTLRSLDDGWEFGHGPVLADTSLRMVAFLCGVSEEPPRRVAPRR